MSVSFGVTDLSGRRRPPDCTIGPSHTQHSGMHVLWGRCYEGDGAPAFWPWVQILRGAVRETNPEDLAALGDGATDVTQLVPELRQEVPQIPIPEPTSSPAARFRVFDGIASFLGRSSRSTPALIIIDDLQGADPSSLRLLEFMARELRTMPLLMVATYRNIALSDTTPLTAMLVEVLRISGVERLMLSGLSAAEVAQFIELNMSVTPAPSLVTMLHQCTEGNPLFVGEYVRLLLSQGEATMRTTGPTSTLVIPVGLGGRDRTTSTDLERARQAVSKRIKAAIAKIRAANLAAGLHLSRTVRTGTFCAYLPEGDERLDWLF